MDVFSALQTSVSGLRAQAYALENIAGNIANSQTVGFKRVDTSFQDMIPDLPPNRTAAGSVAAFSQLTNTLGGNIAATGISTNMALSGQGFFSVQGRTGEVDGRTIFGGPDLYTRRGDFTLDKNGNLVNGAGYYLKGDTGVITISGTAIPAERTQAVTYAANLPKVPITASGEPLLAAPTGAILAAGAAGPATAAITGADVEAFEGRSLSAGSFTAYDAVGTPVDVQMRWAKVGNGDATATPPTGGTWNLFYQTNSDPGATEAAWVNVGRPFTFGSAGGLVSPAGGSVEIANLQVDDVTVGNVTLNAGPTGLTNYASQSGLVETRTLTQDGYAAGTLNGLAVTADGKITGSYSNGRTLALAQVAIVQFNADNALRRENNGTYSQTLESGQPILGLNGATIIGGNVEQSNTDIAAEFSKIIVTQQAYSANTRVMTTAQQMMSDILNVIR